MILDGRRTTYALLIVNLALILFITIRAGSSTVKPQTCGRPPLAVHVIDHAPAPRPDTLVLIDFEKPNDLINMYWQGGYFTTALTDTHVTHGRRALVIDRERDNNIELATVHFPTDWEGYRRLEFDVYHEGEGDGTIWLRVGSKYDADRFYVASQKFARPYVLHPGANTISIPLEDIAGVFGGLPPRKSLHFNFPADGPRRYYVDFLRLVRDVGPDE